jgi:hypothetical protein
MKKYTNKHNLPLLVANWLALDEYDHNPDPNTISVTTLIKPVRQTILSSRLPPNDQSNLVDVMDLVASKIGTAIHNSIEESITKHDYKLTLSDLGYPSSLINRVKVNPTVVEDDDIPIYLEQRVSKQFGKWTISGRFDFVYQGEVFDIKSTSIYTYIKQTNLDKYKLQGSLYRWLNPVIINSPLDTMSIVYVFKDWSAGMVARTTGYPPTPVYIQKIPLLSLQETQVYITNKVNQLSKYWDAPESEIPYCTDEDLWRDPDTFKYYKNPHKLTRSTANFDSYYEAHARYVADGSVGLVKTIKGVPKACKYCASAQLCRQKDIYIADRSLVL